MSVFKDSRIPTHADPTSTRHVNLIGMQLQYVFPPWTLLPGGWPIHPTLGFWGSNVPQNGRLAARMPQPPWKIWRRWLYPCRRNP